MRMREVIEAIQCLFRHNAERDNNGIEFYRRSPMRRLRHTEFAALLTRADVSQAAFARFAGVTPRQVNNWCRARAAVPAWAALIAVLLDEQSPEALTNMVEEVRQNPRRRRSGAANPLRQDRSTLPGR